MTENIKTKFEDILFVVFYIGLFVAQLIPSIVAAFIGIESFMFLAACIIGGVAMALQFVKFPCVATRMWNCGMFALVIITVLK